MYNRSIQSGGAIITVLNPESGERTILPNPIGNSHAIFNNIDNLECISLSSYGSFVFVGHLPSNPNPIIEIRSQVRSKIGRPLTQDQSLSRPRNKDVGKKYNRVCMKVVFVGHKKDKFSGDAITTKEIVTREMAEQEITMQNKMYKKLISGGSGVDMAVIPDVFGSCLLTPDQFEPILLKNNDDVSVPLVKRRILKWILDKAREKKLKLYVSFIEYLDGFSPFTIETGLHHLATPFIGAYVIAILLKTGCISLDMHPGNIIVNDTDASVRFIDFGRLICLFTHLGRAELKRWFNDYVVYCSTSREHSGTRILEQLDMCFRPAGAVAPPSVDVADIQRKFDAYCDALPTRLDYWLNPRPVSSSSKEDIKEVFDLLTLIGMIDGLCDFSKKEPKQTIFTMQFEYSLNILFGRDIHSPFLIDDIIELRSMVLSNFDDWNKEYLKQKDKPLLDVAQILSRSITPNEELGTPRSADSFEYREDSDIYHSSTSPSTSPSASPSASPGSSSKPERKHSLASSRSSSRKRRKHKRGTSRGSSPSRSSRGGRKPITKKGCCVKRKTGISRRKY
jgi:hypothetical protein